MNHRLETASDSTRRHRDASRLIRRTIAALLFFWASGGLPSVNAEVFSSRRPAEVLLMDPSDLSGLISRNLIIGGVHGRTAEVFLTPEEFDGIRDSGLTIYWRLSEDTDGGRARKAPDGYPSHEEATIRLRTYAEERSDICMLESAGRSLQGRELWWMKLSDRGRERPAPAVQFIAAMHGDEPLGAVLCLRLIDHLIDGFGREDRITRLLETTEIWIMPVMNPDGMEARSRFNAAGVDLNRDFPDPVHEPMALPDGRQPETAAIMAWVARRPPALAANFHTGALVVNYPWDSDWDGTAGYQAAPDDDLFRFIASVYASRNPSIRDGPFPGGITNGSAWYPIRGGMQDWLYYYHGCPAVTVELSRSMHPPTSSFDLFWEENREAMLAFIELVHMGVHGVVTDEETGAPLRAEIRVEGVAVAIFADPVAGAFHRLLLPGEYLLHVEADGYHSAAIPVQVREDGPAVLDIVLASLDSVVGGEAEAAGSGGGCFFSSFAGTGLR